MHYGVKGMKWGVRHDPRVEKARANYVQKRSEAKRKEWSNVGYRLSHPMGGIFGVGKSGLQDRKNEKELETKRKDLDKAAEKYYKTKNFVKNENYKNKLIKKSEKNAGNYRREARDTKNEIDDIKKMGGKSAYWKQHAREEADNYARSETQRLKKQGMSDESARFWGTMSGGAKYAGMTSNWSNQSYINSYVSDLTKSHSNSMRLAKQYTNNKKSLMNYKVGSTTKKKDIKKIYRNNLHFYE